MKISSIFKAVSAFTSNNSPAILSATAAVGVVTTAIVASKDTLKAQKILNSRVFWTEPEDGLSTIDKLKKQTPLVWKCYIPTAVTIGATIASIIMANRIGAKRAAAFMSLYSLSEKAFDEYREKVVEQHGINKEQKVRDSVAQSNVDKNPVESREIIITGTGDVLCYETLTGRYFQSNMETLRKAQNELNSRMLTEMNVSLNEFFREVNLPTTGYGEEVGWTVDKLLDLQFTTVLSEDGRPAISVGYNYTPIAGYFKM